jgi:tetratricopeptide (TPR) repeat protein
MSPRTTESAVVNDMTAFQIPEQIPDFLSIALLPTVAAEIPQPDSQPFDRETEAIRLCEVGKLMLTAKRFEDALAQFEQALAVAPHAVDGWYYRADALACLNCYEEALQSLEQAQELDGFEASHIWVQKAVVLILLNRHNEALNCCNQALRKEPNHCQAWLFRGVALHRLGHYQEAYRSYCRASGQTQSNTQLNIRRLCHDISTYEQAS